MSHEFEITLDQVLSARKLVAPYIHHTPLLKFEYLERTLGKKVWLKCENFQKMGSFKIRGASHFMLNHLAEAKKAGVVTASAGNHAQGVAAISHALGVPATIVMPVNTPPIKVANTSSLGARIQLAGDVLDESFQTARKISEAKGLLFVHPFKDVDVIAGQGTAALEILEDPAFASVEAVLIPIGGGGLFAGCATVIRARYPKVKLYGVVAQNAPTMYESFRHKKVEKVPVDFTLADGVATKQAHPEMLDLILKYADDVIALPEESISHSISLLAEEAKIIAEGAGALSVAALLDDRIAEKNVVCLISGGNVDIPALSKVLYRGLVAQGRLIRLVVTISDRPGGLHKLTGALSELGANILQVFHHRSTLRVGIGQTQLEVEMETRDPEHTKEIIETLRDKNWKVDRVF